MKAKKVTRPKGSRKVFDLIWICDDMTELPSFATRRMFGGLSIYLHGKMVLCLMESPGDRSWKEKDYGFDLWNGLMLPTSREHHDSLISNYPSLVSHPVLGKWLYLPLECNRFESTAVELAQQIISDDPRMGIYPQPKKARKKPKTRNKKTTQTKKTNTLKKQKKRTSR